MNAKRVINVSGGDGVGNLSQKCENCDFLKLAIFQFRREEPTFETGSRIELHLNHGGSGWRSSLIRPTIVAPNVGMHGADPSSTLGRATAAQLSESTLYLFLRNFRIRSPVCCSKPTKTFSRSPDLLLSFDERLLACCVKL